MINILTYLLKKVNHTMIFYEAPHRITDTLNNILEVFGNRKMCLAREISKKYEEIYRGTISDVIKETENIKGEIVFLVEGNKEVETFDDLSVIDHVNMFIEDGLSQMDAIKKVAKLRKIPKSDVYNQYHK